MNSFTIPPSPNWFNSNILACAPDNTLVYGSKNELVIIHPTTADDEAPKVEILSDEDCIQKVVCVDVNPQWGSTNKQVLCSWEDRVVKIWNMTLMQWKKCNLSFKGEKDNLVGARFLSEDRILCVTDSGTIVICHNIPQMRYTYMNNLFTSKVFVTCFEPCPHLSHTVALGLKTGLIVVVDLRKNGYITHRFRGHTGDITSLSWCPAPVNIFPRKPGTLSLATSKAENTEENGETTSQEKGGELTSEQIDISVTDCSLEENEHTSMGENKSPEAIVARKQEESEASSSIQENSCETVQSVVETPQKELLFSQDTVETSVQEPQKELSSTDETNDSVVEPQNKLSDESTVEAPQNESTSSIESMAEKLQNYMSPSSEIETVIEQPQNETTNSGEAVTPTVDEPQKEMTDSSEIVTPTVQGPQNGLSDSQGTTSPEKVEMNDGVPVRDLLLASCGKDSSINVWRAKGDGRMLCMFRLPDKRIVNKNKKNNGPWWHTLKWISPFYLLASTNKGEILKFTMPKQINVKQEYTLVHNEHSSFVFAMAAHVPILTTENWFVENDVKLWTFSHDMYLLNTMLDSRVKHLVSIETFCALVNCMTCSPVDPNRIALGLSNGTIKVWNTNNASAKHFSTANYSPRIYGKITYLEWHPENELCIAFCTEEGTVGLINTNSRQKATWFKQYFTSTVHRIQWAPHQGKISLYAIGKGTLVCFDPDNPKEDPVKVDIQEDIIPYYFSWKLDYTMLMVSTTCAKISLYNSSFDLKATYHNDKKMAGMQWHPDSVTSESPKSFWVAVAVDIYLYILDFAEVKEKSGTLNIADIVKNKIEVHYGHIKSIAWNPFNGDQIVTAGDDGLAYVLNVPDGTILSSFYDRKFQPIKTIMWSPTEEDLLIMAASRSATLIGWKATDNKGPLSSDVLKECENRSKNSWKNGSFTQKKEADSEKKIIKSAKNVILPNVSAVSSDAAEEKVKMLREFYDKAEHDKSAKYPSNFLKLFESRDDVLELLNQSEKTHKDKGRLDAAATVAIFKGDLQSCITEAIQQSRVTPLMISLAPSVSISLWHKACETYALQLRGKPDADPLEVATHFLASQNVEKAIEHLCEKELYKEALALAKSRFPADSVIVEDIIKKWASHCTACGNLETAALCFIKLKKYEEAVQAIFRRADVELLAFAYDLAEITGNAELIKAVKFRYEAYAEENAKRKGNQLLQEDGCALEEEKQNGISEEKDDKARQEMIESINTEHDNEKCNYEENKQPETKVEEKEIKVHINGLNVDVIGEISDTCNKVTESEHNSSKNNEDN